jgi:hypothetical protein
MYPILHMCAKNDYYGNPQRLYVMSDEDGKFIQCWDEGYNGYHAVPEELRNDAYLAQRVNVSVTKYKQLLRTLPTSKVSKESFLKVAALIVTNRGLITALSVAISYHIHTYSLSPTYCDRNLPHHNKLRYDPLLSSQCHS